MKPLRRRLLGAATGLLLDRVLGEPTARAHPVVWFGTVMQAVEHRLWADARGRGAVHAATGVALGVASGIATRATAPAVAVSVAGRELRRVAGMIQGYVVAGDLEAARAALPALVGRDPSALDARGVAAAVIESVAENTVDAVIAPVFWAVVAGAPGATAYRAVNTMDAMVGHRGERYGRYGWAAARLDDLATYLPARVFAALVVLCRPRVAIDIVRLVRRDAGAHPSPNAGVAETAVAAALGVELGGPVRYGTTTQDRPALGEGPRPVPADIGAAVVLTDQVEWVLTGLLLAGSLHRWAPTRGRNSA